MSTEARNEGTIVSVRDGSLPLTALRMSCRGEMIELPGGKYACLTLINGPSVPWLWVPSTDLSEGMKVKGTGRILKYP
ncbi:hypothetical protein O9929_23300 [Vibrio lentus]|nr:hypothetical protein [Vibrio lentus]